MGAPSLPQPIEPGPDVAVEPPDLVLAQAPRRPLRVQPRPPEDLVGEQVAQAGDPVLVHQAGLQRRGALPQCGPQLAQGEGQGVGTEQLLIGVQDDPTQSPGIPHAEMAAADELEGEPVPRRLVPVAAVDQVVQGGCVVDHEPARHPEAQAQDRPLAPIRVQ